MASWREAFNTYRQPRLLAILFMGFSSGLPLPLTGATLSYWLAKSGVTLTAIGLFALVGISYNFKFLWSPLIDTLPIPVLTRRLGRRRSWALVIQALLALAILALGFSNPGQAPVATALIAVVVAFLSASQDIVIDAYRIELLKPDEQAAGAAATQWGYRLGLLAAGWGAFHAAAIGGWSFAYAVMAALIGVGMLTVWLTREPVAIMPPVMTERGLTRFSRWFRQAVVAPLADFLKRPLWAEIVLFVVLYKFGDALAGVMANPLYAALHFTEGEVADISKAFGIGATLVGFAAGGLLMARLSLYPSLLICGVLQNVTTLMYAVLASAGHDLWVFGLSVALENVTGGMGSAVFVAYLSRLCNVSFTATQYALLSSLAAVGRTTLSSSGGWLVTAVGWVPFFVIATVAGLPALAVLFRLIRRAPIPAVAAA